MSNTNRAPGSSADTIPSTPAGAETSFSASASKIRVPGAIQGWVLVASAWLSVIASSLIGPVLPRMASAFQTTPGLGVKLSLVATLPALFVAVLSVPMGLAVDKLGRKQILFWTVVLYGFVGTAPVWLGSLDSIILSRVLVGVAEAAIMTASTALIGDYFAGQSRGRWLAMQTGTAPFVSITMLFLGGLLGDRSWRAPFVAYGFAFLLIPLVLFFLWEPKREDRMVETEAEAAASASGSFNWAPLAGICLLTVFAMTAFLITIIQSGFLLSERGMTSPAQIGLWSAIASIANPVGAGMFGLTRWRTGFKLVYAFTMMTVGYAVIALLPGVPAIIIGSIIANLGTGFVLPTLITWALSTLPPAQRGRGTGLWMTASFLGQFLSPLVVLFLAKQTGSLDHAVLTYAFACAVIAAASVISLRKSTAT